MEDANRIGEQWQVSGGAWQSPSGGQEWNRRVQAGWRWSPVASEWRRWTGLDRDKNKDTETRTQRQGHGDKDMETTIWRQGHGDSVNKLKHKDLWQVTALIM